MVDSQVSASLGDRGDGAVGVAQNPGFSGRGLTDWLTLKKKPGFSAVPARAGCVCGS